MKITYIVDRIYNDQAGTENQVLKLAHGLSARHEVELIALGETAWLTEFRDKLPCKVSVFHLGGIAKRTFVPALVALVRHLRSSSPDVVHTFFPIANILGVIGARIAKVPRIISSRRDYGHWMTPTYLAATRFANRFADEIITNSKQVGELTVRVEGYPGQQVQVIPNGVDVDRMRVARPHTELKQSLGIPQSASVVGLVGNFKPIKRQDTLIDALALLRDAEPNLRVLLIGATDGSGPGSAPAAKQHAEQRGVADWVHFSQANGNVAAHLSILDIGVNCSESEGLSNAVVEYMCAGVPCVVSNGGGNPDLVKHDQTGLVFPVGDAAALAASLSRLLNDSELRRRLADAALTMVQQTMSLPSVLARFETRYAPLSDASRPEPAQAVSPKAMVKSAAFGLLSNRIVLGGLRNVLAQRSVTVMMYHELGCDDESADAWQIVRRSDFLRQIDFMRRHYEVVSLDNALERLNADRFGDRPMAVITFDDGHRGLHEHLLPIMQREQLPATIYIATRHVAEGSNYWFDRIVNVLQRDEPQQVDLRRHGLGLHSLTGQKGASNWAKIQDILQAIKAVPPEQCDAVADDIELQLGRPAHRVLAPMTLAEVRDLAACPLVTIGAHTHGHEILPALADDAMRQSVETSADLLARWTGQRPVHFAFPSGVRDNRSDRIVQGLGFRTAASTVVGNWRKTDSLMAIPRIPVGRYDKLEEVCVRMAWGSGLAKPSSGQPAARP